MTLAGFKSRCTMPFSCRGRERVAERAGNLDDLLDREPAGGNEAVEWLALDQLHGQEVDAVGFLHRVDGDDVRVVELGEGLRFTAKARQPLRILRHPGGQHLKALRHGLALCRWRDTPLPCHLRRGAQQFRRVPTEFRESGAWSIERLYPAEV